MLAAAEADLRGYLLALVGGAPSGPAGDWSMLRTLTASDGIEGVRTAFLADVSPQVAHSGPHGDARAELAEAVSQFRPLADEDPVRFGPCLAMALALMADELLTLGSGRMPLLPVTRPWRSGAGWPVSIRPGLNRLLHPR